MTTSTHIGHSSTIDYLKELAKTGRPFRITQGGGIDPRPEVDPGGAWKPQPTLAPEDALKTTGVFKLEVNGCDAVLFKYFPPKSKPTTRRGPVSHEVNQNAHAWALLNDRELTPTQLAVGMRIHYYAFAPSSGGKCIKARATLADHCGVSESTLKRAAQALVERGYFQRTDSGQGGRAGRGKSVYVPTLPTWMEQGVH